MSQTKISTVFGGIQITDQELYKLVDKWNAPPLYKFHNIYLILTPFYLFVHALPESVHDFKYTVRALVHVL